MEIVLEKSQVVDLRLDLHKQGISIGDDLDLVVTDQYQFILYFEPKRTIWSGTVRQNELETGRVVS